MQLRRMELLPGVYLSSLQTDRFKSDCLSLSLLTALDRETVSKNALLPRVLARGTARHPDLDSLNDAMDELYGAQILPLVRKKGEILALGFYAGFLSAPYVPGGEGLLEGVASLLGELLLNPLTRGGLLRRDYVESEREKLVDDIRARVNDKRGYAALRLMEEMCAYEAYGCDELGSEEAAESVGYVELTKYYRQLLQTAPIEIFYCGASSQKDVAAALREALMTLPRGELDEDLGTDVRMNAVEDRPREFRETMDVGQGKLCMGFRLGECMEDPDFAAIRVFNALFGGGVNSRLFRRVREELSLCYYADSACDAMKGVMLVSSGVDPEHFDRTREEILTQLDALRAGDFSDGELQSAANTVASLMRSIPDSPGALESYYLFQTLCGLDYGPEVDAELCAMVTREDVIAVARSVELDAVYCLEGRNEESECEEDAADAED